MGDRTILFYHEVRSQHSDPFHMLTAPAASAAWLFVAMVTLPRHPFSPSRTWG